MSNKQLFALFICALVPWTISQGLIALLAIYAGRLGADSAMTGSYLAVSYFALTIGTLGGGWLSDRFRRRRAFIITCGLAGIPATWLMGQVTELWQLVALTAVISFCFGLTVSLVNILAGMFAREDQRGKVFGLLTLNGGLGSLIGATLSGQIADHWGYNALFTSFAPAWFIQVVFALLLQDKLSHQTPAEAVSTSTSLSPGPAFYLLLSASVVSAVAAFIAILGRPLRMDELGFDASSIAGAVAVGGAVAIPFPFLMGWLSDRIGRYILLALCFLSVGVGVASLTLASAAWHFWLSAIFLTVGGAAGAIGSALVADLVPVEVRAGSIARFNATGWGGAVIGTAVTGYGIQAFGMTKTLLFGLVLNAIALLMLAGVRRLHQTRLAGKAFLDTH